MLALRGRREHAIIRHRPVTCKGDAGLLPSIAIGDWRSLTDGRGMHRSFTSPSSAIRSLALLGLLATWGGSSSAFGQAGGATIADLARDAGADRTERLIAGAKREGMV